TMARVVEETEKYAPAAHRHNPFERSEDVSTGVAAAAVAAAEQLGISTIVTYTERGATARLISEYRPRARILALTPDPDVVR
ncbi:pyruvate kinase alpha/beta domain-containing protein, partial [Escherichia coli]